MIVRYEETRVLADREALSYILKRSPHTIRAKLEPIERDEKGRALYVLDDAKEKLEGVLRRRRRSAA